MKERLHIQSSTEFLVTILTGLLGVAFYVALRWIQWPFIMVDLFMLGLLPSITIIAIAGAIRGPIAGFLTGYIGEVAYGLLSHGVVVTATLPALAYGIMGFVVGFARYDLTNGRSLAKLSVLATIGFVFTALLVTVFGLMVEGAATLAVIGFVMLPLITLGLPTALFLTPVLARLWHAFMSLALPGYLPE
ncbi:MAG: hypothetical protein ACFE7R_02540 [Candidatus Hodarchaeota archaeon]